MVLVLPQQQYQYNDVFGFPYAPWQLKKKLVVTNFLL